MVERAEGHLDLGIGRDQRQGPVADQIAVTEEPWHDRAGSALRSCSPPSRQRKAVAVATGTAWFSSVHVEAEVVERQSDLAGRPDADRGGVVVDHRQAADDHLGAVSDDDGGFHHRLHASAVARPLRTEGCGIGGAMRTGSGQTSLGTRRRFGNGGGEPHGDIAPDRTAIARSVMARSMSSCAVSYRGAGVARLPFCVGRQVGDLDRCRLWPRPPQRPDGCPGFPRRTGSAPAARSLQCAGPLARLLGGPRHSAAPPGRPGVRCPRGRSRTRASPEFPSGCAGSSGIAAPSAPPRAAPVR
jgi:hypothetical protein